MKSVQIKNGGGLENLSLIQDDPAEPKAGEVLVRWKASSLNYHDYLVAVGAIPVAEGRIPMSDGAGEIAALGPGVSQWKVGDRVMSLFFPDWAEGAPTLAKTRAISGESVNGYLTTHSVVSEDALTHIPDGYTFTEAATLPCAALTAWRALFEEGNVQAGQLVLVEGSGGMSMFALQFAKMAGARVIATTSSDEKAEKLKSLGAEQVFNYRTDERWGKSIFKATGGAHHVLDVGGGSTMQQSVEAAAIGGHIYSIGILGNGRKGELTFPKLFFKHLRLTGLAVGSRVMQQRMVAAIEANNLRPLLDRTFTMESIAEAFRHQESGKHFGKIVVEW